MASDEEKSIGASDKRSNELRQPPEFVGGKLALSGEDFVQLSPVSRQRSADAEAQCYLAFGPISIAQRGSLLAMIAAREPDAALFVSEDKGASWIRIDQNDKGWGGKQGEKPTVQLEISEHGEVKSGWRISPPALSRAEEPDLSDTADLSDTLIPPEPLAPPDKGDPVETLAQSRFGVQTTAKAHLRVPPITSESHRTNDEDTLRVENLDDDTVQVSVRRPEDSRPAEGTRPFIIQADQKLDLSKINTTAPHEKFQAERSRSTGGGTSQNQGAVVPNDLKSLGDERPEEERDKSFAENGYEVISEDRYEVVPELEDYTEHLESYNPPGIEDDLSTFGRAKQIQVEQTKKYNKNTPEFTQVIVTPKEDGEGGGKPSETKPSADVAPAADQVKPPPMAQQHVAPRIENKETDPPVHGEIAPTDRGGAPSKAERSSRPNNNRRGQRDDDVSMKVDITAAIPLYRDDTSPRIIVDERAHNRIRYQVTLTLSSSSNFWTGLAEDISGGGLFVATYNTLPIGTQFGVTFSLPNCGSKINGTAEVRWLREYREGLEVPPGMGVCFLNLSEEDRKSIDDFVKNRETIFFEE